MSTATTVVVVVVLVDVALAGFVVLEEYEPVAVWRDLEV